MTEKQKIYADTFLATGNRREAYRAVNPNCTDATADTQSYKWHRKAEVKEYIENAQKEATKGSILSAEQVLQKWSDIANGVAMNHVMISNEALQHKIVECPPTVKEQMDALAKLGKYLGLLDERVTVTNVNPVVVDDV